MIDEIFMVVKLVTLNEEKYAEYVCEVFSHKSPAETLAKELVSQFPEDEYLVIPMPLRHKTTEIEPVTERPNYDRAKRAEGV